MKHSTQQLLDMAYEYFPRGVTRRDPGYELTAEVLRQKAARIPASAQYDRWRGMLRRLRDRFPADQYPGVEVHNQSLFLQVPTAGANKDRCFTGQVWLPIRAPREKHHMLEFLVSFVVPYYAIRSECQIPRQPAPGELDTDFETSFDLTPDEEPFARAATEEIERTFSGYEPINQDVGLTVVPDIVAGSRWFGEATIFTCLFSDSW